MHIWLDKGDIKYYQGFTEPTETTEQPQCTLHQSIIKYKFIMKCLHWILYSITHLAQKVTAHPVNLPNYSFCHVS